ncbi:MAG: Hint domain-containing protein [Pseudomonadota bacterium]
MPDYFVRVYQRVNVGGSDGFSYTGNITVRDDDGNQDAIFNDIETAGSGEFNGDQEVVASSAAPFGVGETIRTRGLYRFENTGTGETFDVYELFSNSVGGFPTETYFTVPALPPAWMFDTGVTRTYTFINRDGTVPYSGVICFAAGTLITCDAGRQVPVEKLKAGDTVLTKDGRYSAVRWVGSRSYTGFAFKASPGLRPIRVRAGALGAGLPERDLIVSPQHRILVRSKIAERMFGVSDVLLPAKKLVGIEGIEIAQDIGEVEYFHILFDRHEVIYSNGALSESLFTGPEALKALAPRARAEVASLFPDICTPSFQADPAGYIPPRGKQVRRLIERHQKNGKSLFDVTAAAPCDGAERGTYDSAKVRPFKVPVRPDPFGAAQYRQAV